MMLAADVIAELLLDTKDSDLEDLEKSKEREKKITNSFNESMGKLSLLL